MGDLFGLAAGFKGVKTLHLKAHAGQGYNWVNSIRVLTTPLVNLLTKSPGSYALLEFSIWLYYDTRPMSMVSG